MNKIGVPEEENPNNGTVKYFKIQFKMTSTQVAASQDKTVLAKRFYHSLES